MYLNSLFLLSQLFQWPATIQKAIKIFIVLERKRKIVKRVYAVFSLFRDWTMSSTTIERIKLKKKIKILLLTLKEKENKKHRKK